MAEDVGRIADSMSFSVESARPTDDEAQISDSVTVELASSCEED